MNKLSQRDSHLGRVPSNSTKSVGNLAVYEECLAKRRRSAKVDPRNTEWQHDEACLLDQIGNEYRKVGLKRQAIGAYEASLAVLRHLAKLIREILSDTWTLLTIWRHLLGREPNNVCWHSNVAQNLEKIGDIKFAAGDSRGASTSYEEMTPDARLPNIAHQPALYAQN
jgi:hypothetical protein